MMMRKKYLFLSFLGHLLILVSIFLYLTMKPNNAETNHSIATYIYSMAAKSAHHQKINNEKKSLPKVNTTPLSTSPLSSKDHGATINQSASTGSQSQLYQENNSARSNRNKTILQILHNAIAEKQIYPDISIELKESGTVKLGFLLSPNGELSNVLVIHSSGFPNIDAAAINAVNASSPVQIAGQRQRGCQTFSPSVEGGLVSGTGGPGGSRLTSGAASW